MILDIGANGDLDVTSAEMLDLLVDDAARGGVDLALAEVRLPVLEMARRSGLLDAVGEAHVFRTIAEAVDALSPRLSF